MPGIIGFVKNESKTIDYECIKSAQDDMHHFEFYKNDEIVETEKLFATKVDIDVLSERKMPIKKK